MSDDLIKKSGVYKAVDDWLVEKPIDMSAFYNAGYENGYKQGIADRPQGKWLDVWQDGICSWRGTCSVCRSTNDIPPPFEANFCPSCGARMKGADDE